MTLLRGLFAIVVLSMTFAAGFAAGVYTLPIVNAQRDAAAMPPSTASPEYRSGTFARNLTGSDPLFGGTGDPRKDGNSQVLEDPVELALGPDYRVYLTRRFIGDRPGFLAAKADSIEVGSLMSLKDPLTFDVSPKADTGAFDKVLVWCEAFSMLITSARLD